MNIYLILDSNLGVDLGPNFLLTSDFGTVTPSASTKIDLITGIDITVDDINATQIYVTSQGTCTNTLTLTIITPTTTTTTLAPTTTTTTTDVTTTTTTLSPTTTTTTLAPTTTTTTEVPTTTTTTLAPTTTTTTTDVPTTTTTTTAAPTTTTTAAPTTTTTTTSCVNYGLLYNWYAVSGASPISNNNAHLPSDTEWSTLVTYLGGSTVAGGLLKEEGTTHWLTPNTGADNTLGFTARGAGNRTLTIFEYITLYSYFWTSTPFDAFNGYYRGLNYSNTTITDAFSLSSHEGFSVRLIIDAPNTSGGTEGTYIGNDGQTYKCVLINGTWWLAENLRETKYQNNSLIPEVTGNTAWSVLSTGALCAYNNDWNNVGCITYPTTTTTTTEAPTTTTTTTAA